MKGRLTLAGTALVAAAALVAVPLTSASSVESKLQIGFSLHFTGPSTTEGTFVASGAVNDSGLSSVSGLTIVPFGNQDNGRLTGTQVFAGSLGTITTTFKGVAGPVTAPHQAGRGTFRVVSGTGAYAGLRGRGEFLVVVDVTTNQIIGTDDGEAN